MVRKSSNPTSHPCCWHPHTCCPQCNARLCQEDNVPQSPPPDQHTCDKAVGEPYKTFVYCKQTRKTYSLLSDVFWTIYSLTHRSKDLLKESSLNFVIMMWIKSIPTNAVKKGKQEDDNPDPIDSIVKLYNLHLQGCFHYKSRK